MRSASSTCVPATKRSDKRRPMADRSARARSQRFSEREIKSALSMFSPGEPRDGGRPARARSQKSCTTVEENLRQAQAGWEAPTLLWVKPDFDGFPGFMRGRLPFPAVDGVLGGSHQHRMSPLYVNHS